MPAENIISFLLFIVFILSYSFKLIIQARQNKINAFVLGKGSKSAETRSVEFLVRISTFVWGAIWVAEALFEKAITRSVGTLVESSIVEYVGLILTAMGLLVFIKAMVDMKSSWRVGIDKETTTKLVLNGLYRYSRNPAFVGFDLMFTGLFLSYPNFLTLLVAVINITALHLLILQEEQHLKASFGDQYAAYIRKTPRYFKLG